MFLLGGLRPFLRCGLRPRGGVGLRPMDWVACGQKSEKILVENLREYFRIAFVVFALFSQFKIQRAGVNRQNRIFLLAYARRYDGRGLREMFSETQGYQLTQRRHLAPCRKRNAIPARQRYKLFCSICPFFLSRGGGGLGLRTVLRCGLRPMRGVRPAAD